jgi:hypothetical protein
VAPLVARIPQFGPAIVEECLNANASPTALDARSLRSRAATAITHQAIERLLREKRSDPWGGFDNRYPKATGYIEFSVPAFSEDGSQATIGGQSSGWKNSG